MPGLLYPAYQKLYSALVSLDRFNKEANFFDNISCIDTFFAEYRNVTFVLQKALKHTEFFGVYETNRDRYLTDQWFVKQRNGITKERPFQLIKELKMVVFLPFGGFHLRSQSFSIEDDAPLCSLLDEIKTILSSVNEREVFFSAYFSFHEKGSDIDLLKKLSNGVIAMLAFMDSMDKSIGEDCPLCDELKSRINELGIPHVPLEYLLVNDYVYYPDIDKFERADRFALICSPNRGKVFDRCSITLLTESKYFNYDGTIFGNFTLMHASIKCRDPKADIFPAILIAFRDGSFDLEAFQSSMKTTVYRKLFETAQIVKNEDVFEVCYMNIYLVASLNEERMHMTSKERQKLATSEIMACASIDCNLNEKEYVFDGEKLKEAEYVFLEMEKGYGHKLDITRSNLFPIWYAFKCKRENEESLK